MNQPYRVRNKHYTSVFTDHRHERRAPKIFGTTAGSGASDTGNIVWDIKSFLRISCK